MELENSLGAEAAERDFQLRLYVDEKFSPAKGSEAKKARQVPTSGTSSHKWELE